MRTPAALGLISLLVLAGFGCSGAAPAANTPAANVPATTGNANANVNAPAATSGARQLPAATGIDATWRTYTNKALGFTLQTPTEGRYAPTWEVNFPKPGDAHIVDGCYVPDAYAEGAPERVQVNGIDFCVSASEDAGAGQFYVMRDAVTKIGETFVRIAFVNHTVNAGNVDCNPMPESGKSTSATSCVPFIAADYQAQIDAILATFRLTQ